MGFSRYARQLFITLCLLNTVIGLLMMKGAFTPPGIFTKDFTTCFLSGLALQHGVDPYLPATELARHFQQADLIETTFNHPTPHTLLHDLLVFPFTFFSYRTAYLLWCVFSLGCLLAACRLLVRWWTGGSTSLETIVLFACGAFGWWPITYDLWQGQINLLLFILFVLAWLAFRQGKEVLTGVLLGTTIAVKLLAWPLVLFLLLQRRWRGVLAAGSVLAGANALSLALLGWEGLSHYYLKIGPAIAQLYVRFYFNLSLWSVGHRLFSGVGKQLPGETDPVGAPLYYAPQFAQGASLVIVLTVLATSLWLAWKSHQADTQFCLLLCISILVSPAAWQGYLLVTLLPIVIVFRRLRETGFPAALTLQAVLWFLLISIPNWALRALSERFVIGRVPDGREVISFSAISLNMAPTLFMLGWCWLVWRSDKISLSAA